MDDLRDSYYFNDHEYELEINFIRKMEIEKIKVIINMDYY